MAPAGANIAIWARDEAKSAAAVAGLEKLGVRAIALTCDVADEAQVAAAMERTVDELGPLGCLIANSGTSDRRTVVDSSLEDWHRVMRVNLDGTFLTCREAARRFVAQGSGGSIVVVSSMISAFGAQLAGERDQRDVALNGLRARTCGIGFPRSRSRAVSPRLGTVGYPAGQRSARRG